MKKNNAMNVKTASGETVWTSTQECFSKKRFELVESVEHESTSFIPKLRINKVMIEVRRTFATRFCLVNRAAITSLERINSA